MTNPLLEVELELQDLLGKIFNERVSESPRESAQLYNLPFSTLGMEVAAKAAGLLANSSGVIVTIRRNTARFLRRSYEPTPLEIVSHSSSAGSFRECRAFDAHHRFGFWYSTKEIKLAACPI